MSENIVQPIKLTAKANSSKNIRWNAIGMLATRGISMGCSYFVIPLLISYLDIYRYGIWVTIFSLINWFQFFDMGLGNGLRNKYAESIALNDVSLAKTYVSTTYYLISLISGGMLLVFCVIYPFVNWHSVFNVDHTVGNELNWLVFFVFMSFVLSFPLKLINSILYGAQKSAFANSITSVANIISLFIIYFFLDKHGTNTLLKVGIIYTFVPVVLFLLTNIYFFAVPFRAASPSLKFINFKYIKDLTGLGIKFFILQLNALILFSTNSFIIAQTLGQAKVSEYNILFKYYCIPNMIYNIVLTPYWSAFTNAYVKDDIAWMKKNLKMLIWLLALLTVMSILMLIFNKPLFHLWLKDKIKPSQSAGIYFVIYLFVQAAMQPFVNFVNGVGKVKLQLYIATLISVINIPLSIYFINGLHLGINGCIIANIICTLPFLIFMSIQTYKLLNKNATGVWND